MNHLSDRAIRQRELVPPEQLDNCRAVVVGVGAIGRQVALQLAALGIPYLTLIDHDLVAVENLAAQAFRPNDLGRTKVDATAELCAQLHPAMHITVRPERFRRSMMRDLPSDIAVFLCVDSITTRQTIWQSVRMQVRLMIDGRMNAEVLRVLSVDRPKTDRRYETTFFEASEAYAGSCTARSTNYTAAIAAGFMVCQLARHLRQLRVIADQTLNLLSAELTVVEVE